MSTVIKYFGPNDIELWATETLSQEELNQFQTAFANNLTYLNLQRDNGKFVIEELYETVSSTLLNTQIDILVGEKLIFAEGSSLETDCAPIPEYYAWIRRYYDETGGDYLIKD